MPELIAMVGLPRSGKTTACQKLKAEGYTIVSPDSFRMAIHGMRFLIQAEPFVWAAVYAAVDALLLAGNNVVVDACNQNRKRRAPWYERGAKFIVIGTSKEECIARARALGDEEIIPHIERMASTWESL